MSPQTLIKYFLSDMSYDDLEQVIAGAQQRARWAAANDLYNFEAPMYYDAARSYAEWNPKGGVVAWEKRRADLQARVDRHSKNWIETTTVYVDAPRRIGWKIPLAIGFFCGSCSVLVILRMWMGMLS